MKKYVITSLYVLLALTTAWPVAARSEVGHDLMHIPAAGDPGATSAVLLDVVHTGDRLVAVGERGIVIYSEDHAATWRQARVPTSITLTAVCFPTPLNGWAVGHDGVILHSNDGGAHWEKQLDGGRVNRAMLNQVDGMLKSKREDLSRAELSRAEQSYCRRIALELEDLQFFRTDVCAAVNEGAGRPFMDVWFKNDREGIAVGAFGMILRTGDGGRRWEPMLDRIHNPEGYHYYGISRAGDFLFIAGEGGLVYRSGDEGNTWEKLESPYDGSFFGVAGNPFGGEVVVFGLKGNAFLSRDAGVTWARLDTPRGVSLGGGKFLSNGTLALVGYSGLLLQSGDMGKTIEIRRTACRGCVGVAASEDGRPFLVGLDGLVNASGTLSIQR